MGFLLLFDVTNESSFLSVQDWLTLIDTYTRMDNELRPPILLVGNKIDLVTNRVIETLRAQQIANDLQITYIETSAVTGTNVSESLRLLVEKIFDFMQRSMQKFYSNQSSTIKINALDPTRRISTSMKIKNKLARAKKHACPCT